MGCKGRLLSATFQGELIRRVAGGARASQIWLIGCSALCLQPISILQLNSHHPVVLGDPLLPPIPSTFLFGFGVGNFFFGHPSNGNLMKHFKYSIFKFKLF